MLCLLVSANSAARQVKAVLFLSSAADAPRTLPLVELTSTVFAEPLVESCLHAAVLSGMTQVEVTLHGDEAAANRFLEATSVRQQSGEATRKPKAAPEVSGW